MLAGSVMGVPGPVARMRPPCTWRDSTAVGGRYRPTLVRSSPSSGAMRPRSPPTIKRFGALSAMGLGIPLPPAARGPPERAPPRPVVDRRLAGTGVPAGSDRFLLLGGARQVSAAVLPGDGAGGGRVGHHGLALHHSVPLRPRPLSGGAAHVVVGRGPHGVVLLVRPGALPPGIRGLDLGTDAARGRAVVANPEEPGHVALRHARFELARA